MTAFVFVIALIAGGMHWAYRGYYVVGSIQIFPIMFMATLATASLYALFYGDWKRKTLAKTLFALATIEPRHKAAMLILWAKFAVHFWAWESTPDPVLTLAILDFAVAAYFILFGVRRWELAIGGITLMSLVIGISTAGGIVPSVAQRPDVYIALGNHADLIAIFGHIVNVALGLGAGDGGKRVRSFMAVSLPGRPMGVALGRRILSRLRLVRPSSAITED